MMECVNGSGSNGGVSVKICALNNHNHNEATMNNENTLNDSGIKDFSWMAIPALYFAMFLVVISLYGVSSFNSHILLSYAAEAAAPLLIGLVIAAVYHGIRKGQSAWKRNTFLISSILYGVYLIGVLNNI